MKVSINDKRLLLAKKRLNKRNLIEITAENKEEYYKNTLNDYLAGVPYTERALLNKQYIER